MAEVVTCPKCFKGLLCEVDNAATELLADGYKVVCSKCGSLFKEASEAVLGHTSKSRSFKGYRVRKQRLNRA